MAIAILEKKLLEEINIEKLILAKVPESFFNYRKSIVSGCIDVMFHVDNFHINEIVFLFFGTSRGKLYIKSIKKYDYPYMTWLL